MFLDLSKTFDRVWHAGLHYRLGSNGISDDLLKLISICLPQRQHRVILNEQSSEFCEVSAESRKIHSSTGLSRRKIFLSMSYLRKVY